MHLRTVVFARHLRHAAISIVPVVICISQVGIFDKCHVRIGSPAVEIVCAVKIQVTDGGVVHEFHVHTVANPLVADVVGPEALHMLRRGPNRFKAIATFNQVRVHVINGKVAVNVVVRALVTAHHYGCATQVRAATHAHEALVRLGGNPVAPRLQIVRLLHDFKSGFAEACATVLFEGDAVKLVRLARHAVLLAASRAAPSTPLLVRLGYRIAHLPKIVSAFGHKDCHRIVTLQVLADACGIARENDIAGSTARRRSAKSFGLHVEREQQNGRRVGFGRSPNPLGLRIRGKTIQGCTARKLVACVVKGCRTAPLAKVAALVFPRVVAHCRL